MTNLPSPLDLKRLKVFPLAERRSESRLEDILVEPAEAPRPCPESVMKAIHGCAQQIKTALDRKASVMLIYGAHLIKNGGQLLLTQMLERGWLTHLATNGAGVIHDWEFSFLGRSTESVRDNVAAGTFGTWDETGRYIHLALLAGGLQGDGFGCSIGRFVYEDGVTLPAVESLEKLLRDGPSHPLTPARADLLQAMRAHRLAAGRHLIPHRWRNTCVLANAFHQEVPVSVHRISDGLARRWKGLMMALCSRSAQRSWARRCLKRV